MALRKNGTGRGWMKGRRLRVTKVDSCGRPIFGDGSQAVSSGFISAAWTANTDDTDEINQQNAAGDRCLYAPAESKLSGYTLELQFCEVDPELFSLVTGQRVYLDANGVPIGFAINTKVSLNGQGFALEIWAGSKPTNTCDTPGVAAEYGYFLTPFLTGGILGDYTIENGAINFTISGATTRDGNHWGVGPYQVMPNAAGTAAATLPTALDVNDHMLVVATTIAPPDPFYGTRPLLNPAATPQITGISAALATRTATITFTGGSATTPVWIDYGDGTWDYITNTSTTNAHTYAAGITGVVTIKASSDGATWKTATVTLP